MFFEYAFFKKQLLEEFIDAQRLLKDAYFSK